MLVLSMILFLICLSASVRYHNTKPKGRNHSNKSDEISLPFKQYILIRISSSINFLISINVVKRKRRPNRHVLMNECREIIQYKDFGRQETSKKA